MVRQFFAGNLTRESLQEFKMPDVNIEEQLKLMKHYADLKKKANKNEEAALKIKAHEALLVEEFAVSQFKRPHVLLTLRCLTFPEL